jgi:hypothetical protein
MITEIYYDEEDKKIKMETYRAVAIKPYPNSTEGGFPLHASDCPHEGGVSCFTQSWSSVCGGYMGHAGHAVIRCQEPLRDKHDK